MSKRKAVKVESLLDLPADLPEVWWRIERRHWPDGTSCLHGMKWGIQPKTRRPAPWKPLQYFQVPWELAPAWLEDLKAAVDKGNQSQAI